MMLSVRGGGGGRLCRLLEVLEDIGLFVAERSCLFTLPIIFILFGSVSLPLLNILVMLTWKLLWTSDEFVSLVCVTEIL